MPFQYEEYRDVGRIRRWVIVGLFCALILVWGLLNYRLIPDAPRHWDMGEFRDVPGKSVYSTVAPRGGYVPRQLAPLPEGAPLKGR